MAASLCSARHYIPMQDRLLNLHLRSPARSKAQLLVAFSALTRGKACAWVTSAYLHWVTLFNYSPFKELLIFPVRKVWATQFLFFVCPFFNFQQSRLTVLKGFWTWSCSAPGSVDRGGASVRDNHHFSNNEYISLCIRNTSYLPGTAFHSFFSIPSFFKKIINLLHGARWQAVFHSFHPAYIFLKLKLSTGSFSSRL